MHNKISFQCSISDLIQYFIDVILCEVEILKKESKFITKKDKRIEIDYYSYK